MIAMLGANSASADLSKFGVKGVKDANTLMRMSKTLVGKKSRARVLKTFRGCEGELDDVVGPDESEFFCEPDRHFSFNDKGVLSDVYVSEGGEQTQLAFGEWIATAWFTFDDKLGVKFKKIGKNSEGAEEVVWVLPDRVFFIMVFKDGGTIWAADIGVRLR
jgi:hypothetical protein